MMLIYARKVKIAPVEMNKKAYLCGTFAVE